MAKFKPLPPLEELQESVRLRPRDWVDLKSRIQGKILDRHCWARKGYVLLLLQEARQYTSASCRLVSALGTGAKTLEMLRLTTLTRNDRSDNRICLICDLATMLPKQLEQTGLQRVGISTSASGKWGKQRYSYTINRFTLVMFLTAEEAKAAYDAKAVELRGEFAPQAWRQGSA